MQTNRGKPFSFPLPLLPNKIRRRRRRRRPREKGGRDKKEEEEGGRRRSSIPIFGSE
jgi:hypothetical protein